MPTYVEELEKLALSESGLSVIAPTEESPYHQQMAESFSALVGLGDPLIAVITSPALHQTLRYDGTVWVNTSILLTSTTGVTVNGVLTVNTGTVISRTGAEPYIIFAPDAVNEAQIRGYATGVKITNAGAGTTWLDVNAAWVSANASGQYFQVLNGVDGPYRATVHSDTATHGATFLGIRTRVGPAAVQTNDVLTGIYGAGYGTSNTAYVAAIRFLAAENFGATNHGTYMEFSTTAITSNSRTVRMRLAYAWNEIGRSLPTITYTPNSRTGLIVHGDGANGTGLDIVAPLTTGTQQAELWFSKVDAQFRGRIRYELDTERMELWVGAAERWAIDSAGVLSTVTDPGAPAEGVALLRTSERIRADTAVIGEYGASYAVFEHAEAAGSGAYALLQGQPGGGDPHTFLNAPTGSDIKFRNNNVDIGWFDEVGLLIRAGGVTGNPTVKVGGVLSAQTGNAGNVTTTETDLLTYSIPANALNATGRTIKVVAWGIFANNANTKTVRFKFGSVTVATFANVTSASGMVWYLVAYITRTGASAQEISASFHWHDGSLVNTSGAVTSATETDTAAIVVKFTGQSDTASDDVTQTSMYVESLN